MENMLACLSKNLNEYLQHYEGTEMLRHVCEELRSAAESNVLITNNSGKILASGILLSESYLLYSKDTGSAIFIDNSLNERIITESTIENKPLDHYNVRNSPEAVPSGYIAVIIPIFMLNQRLGSLFMYRHLSLYNEEELTAARFCAAITSLILRHRHKEKENIQTQSIISIKSAIGTLSYSELMAVILIVRELNGCDGTVIASKIADNAGFTRSVIVNALRKLESAGIVESRSLGAKGTYIKITNCLFIEEISKLNK